MQKNTYQITSNGAARISGISGQASARTMLERIGSSLVVDKKHQFLNRRADFFETIDPKGTKSLFKIEKV
ncbi:hypothetical protein SEA_WEASELS2_218 [Rhodococcus phage Weasels2]|uniref:Uncharacterized protein n=1 Tax=Rhodococcus phage Weasels2 TaxID=1897437 RepID=A0A1I9SAJ0_9CAUD|nr:hypothetical protein FDH04_gp198 [Rhodococcus phage Weasels2]AOZ63796.1 hypothetical protein SEA_WEASELS2_218 [Rhodococcus phage Weasels2]